MVSFGFLFNRPTSLVIFSPSVFANSSLTWHPPWPSYTPNTATRLHFDRTTFHRSSMYCRSPFTEEQSNTHANCLPFICFLFPKIIAFDDDNDALRFVVTSALSSLLLLSSSSLSSSSSSSRSQEPFKTKGTFGSQFTLDPKSALSLAKLPLLCCCCCCCFCPPPTPNRTRPFKIIASHFFFVFFRFSSSRNRVYRSYCASLNFVS